MHEEMFIVFFALLVFCQIVMYGLRRRLPEFKSESCRRLLSADGSGTL